MAAPAGPSERHLVGIDVGGTKIAGGIVAMPGGRVILRTVQATGADRGGEAVFQDVLGLVDELLGECASRAIDPAGVGLGLAELVSDRGDILSDATIRWKGLDIGRSVAGPTRPLPVRIDADVRAAARAEAMLGAGHGLETFLYVTIGTGISAALVVGGEPFLGHRGLTGTFASGRTLIADERGQLVSGPPLESFASGPAIAARYAAEAGPLASASEVIALADSGDERARRVVESAGSAVGAAIGQLVNLLDPAAVVVGGGLGLVEGAYRRAMDRALRAHIWADAHRGVPLLSGMLGTDAGWIGAALACETMSPEGEAIP